jgi:hypothetical protein
MEKASFPEKWWLHAAIAAASLSTFELLERKFKAHDLSFRRLIEVAVESGEVVLASDSRAVADPLAHDVSGESVFEIGLTAGSESVEQLGPRVDAGTGDDPGKPGSEVLRGVRGQMSSHRKIGSASTRQFLLQKLRDMLIYATS